MTLKKSLQETYDENLRFAGEEELRVRKSRKILKRSEQLVEESRHNKQIDLVCERTGFYHKTIQTFIGIIPPGEQTGMHRHMNEAAIYILEGKGYSVIDGERVEWEEGDALGVPLFAWHQHFNTGDRPARYLAAINQRLMASLGIFKMEQKEDKSY